MSHFAVYTYIDAAYSELVFALGKHFFESKRLFDT